MSQTTVTDEQIESLREIVREHPVSMATQDRTEHIVELVNELDSIVSSLENQKEEYKPNLDSYRDYHERVSVHVDAVEETVEEMAANDERVDAYEAVSRTIDGARVGTMTHESLAALKFSDNSPEEWSMFAGEDPSWSEAINAMAYTVLRQDVDEAYIRRHEDEEDTVHSEAL